jgi:hypothetical protein
MGFTAFNLGRLCTGLFLDMPKIGPSRKHLYLLTRELFWQTTTSTVNSRKVDPDNTASKRGVLFVVRENFDVWVGAIICGVGCGVQRLVMP